MIRLATLAAVLSIGSIAIAADYTASPQFSINHPTGSGSCPCVITWKQTRTSPDFYTGASRAPSLPNIPLYVSASAFQLSADGTPTMTISIGKIGRGTFSGTYESSSLTGPYTFVRGDAPVTWPATITPVAVP